MNILFLLVFLTMLLAWLVFTPYLVFTLKQSSGSSAHVIQLLSYNFAALGIFCFLWYEGFFMSDYWMNIIDEGSPWSWLVVLFGISYLVSFYPLKRTSKVSLKSLIGPLITVPAFFIWVIYCEIKFDPYF